MASEVPTRSTTGCPRTGSAAAISYRPPRALVACRWHVPKMQRTPTQPSLSLSSSCLPLCSSEPFLSLSFAEGKCGVRGGARWTQRRPPPPRLPLMTTTPPPPAPRGRQDHAGVDGGSEALDPPPQALGPAWQHRILGILNTIFVVVVSVIVALLLLPSSAVGALSPYSRRASIAAPSRPQRIDANQIELPPCPVRNDAQSHH